jgi:hypothetical protein
MLFEYRVNGPVDLNYLPADMAERFTAAFAKQERIRFLYQFKIVDREASDGVCFVDVFCTGNHVVFG